MNIVDCIIGIMYIVALGCVLYYINKFQIDKLKGKNKPINKVHFYVTCELDSRGEIIHTLWLSKPCYTKDKKFVAGAWCRLLAINTTFAFYNIAYSDFEDMKNGEIREVFLNLED